MDKEGPIKESPGKKQRMDPKRSIRNKTIANLKDLRKKDIAITQK